MDTDIILSQAAISRSDLHSLTNQYHESVEKAHLDKTYDSDYNAALLAPAAFLNSPSDFESTFDRIVFHLDEAYRKTSKEDDIARRMISKTAEELFHYHIHFIQRNLEHIEHETKKTFGKKVIDAISRIFDDGAGAVSAAMEVDKQKVILNVANAGKNGLQLLDAYFQYLDKQWTVQKEKSYFYNQLATVYQKIIEAKSFKNEFGLLRNTFSRNKTEVINHVLENRGFRAALRLAVLDTNEREKEESFRIIGNWLIGKQDGEGLYEILMEPEYRSIVSDFYRHSKTQIIPAITLARGVEQADHFTEYDANDHQKIETRLIIMDSLFVAENFDALYRYLSDPDIEKAQISYLDKKGPEIYFTLAHHYEINDLKEWIGLASENQKKEWLFYSLIRGWVDAGKWDALKEGLKWMKSIGFSLNDSMRVLLYNAIELAIRGIQPILSSREDNMAEQLYIARNVPLKKHIGFISLSVIIGFLGFIIHKWTVTPVVSNEIFDTILAFVGLVFSSFFMGLLAAACTGFGMYCLDRLFQILLRGISNFRFSSGTKKRSKELGLS